MKTLFSALILLMNLRSGRRNCLRHRLLMNGALIGSLFAPALAHADAVVTEPTEAALDAALAQVAKGGTITFACDGTIPITTTKTIAVTDPSVATTITLDASGHNITLDGGGRTRLFTVAGTATLTDITPYTTGGYTISHQWTPTYASLTLKNLTLANGAVSGGNGGAAALTVGTLTDANCAFRGNTALSGGALNKAQQTFTGSTIVGVSVFHKQGGTQYLPVYNATFSATFAISDCAFTGNTAFNGSAVYQSVSGGAVASASGFGATLTRCAFTNNSASTSVGLSTGGAVYNISSMTDCAFTGNVAGQGGAAGGDSGGTMTAVRCAFSGNHTTRGSGGAIWTDYSVFAVTLSDCLFSGNAANGIDGTRASPTACGGGAMYTVDAKSTLTNCAFVNNRVTGGAYCAVTGGALTLGGYADTLANCTFAGNSAIAGSGSVAQGGALYYGGTPYPCTLTNCTVANNSAAGVTATSGGTGGGLCYVANFPGQGQLTLINTVVANNTATTSGGNSQGTITDGGHNICSDASAAFTSATSLNNTDPRLGPLVYPGGATPTLSLLAGSPAIDAGDDTAAPATDQRGAPRQGSHRDIGAYERPVWQVDGLAVGPDAKTRLLWNKSNAAAQLWNVDTSAGTYSAFWQGGPFSVGTATNVTVGGDNVTNLLWQNANGNALLWRVNTSNGAFLNQHSYGPNPGWTASAMAVGSDNQQRVLWNNANGSTFLWNVNSGTGGIGWGAFYDVIPGWTATALAVGADGNLRVLWNNTSGQMFLWSLNTTTGQLVSGASFGPVPGWTATNIACGKDNNIRVLWQNVSGQTFLWSVDTTTAQIVSGCTFAPRTGWNAAGISVGDDNNTRLLWQKVDGTVELWNVDTLTGATLSTQDYGPLP